MVIILVSVCIPQMFLFSHARVSWPNSDKVFLAYNRYHHNDFESHGKEEMFKS
jgi:hypothetical protein